MNDGKLPKESSTPLERQIDSGTGRFGRRLLILAAVVAAGLYGLVSLAPPSVLDNANGPYAVQLALIGVLILVSLAASRKRLVVIGGQLAVWLLLLMVLIAGYGYRFELMAVLNRIQAELLPSHAQTLDSHSITFRRGPGGHFWIAAQAEGRPVRFLVDTGADVVALTEDDADQLGLRPDPGAYRPMLQTASGTGLAAPVEIARMTIGGHELVGVEAVVVPDLPVSLLGQSALRRLGSVTLKGDRLIIAG